MANRFPNRGHQPPRGMASNRGMSNRGMPNRSMFNEGFNQNKNMTNRGGPTGPGLNTNDSFQQNPGVANSGRPNSGLQSNQGFQGNSNIQNRNMFNPGMNRNQNQYQNQHDRDMHDSGFSNAQGYQSHTHLPNTDRSNFNSDITTNHDYQTDQSFQSRNISDAGMNTNQDFQNDQRFPSRGMSNYGMRNQSFQTGQNFQNRGVINSGERTSQGFQINQSMSDKAMSNTQQGFHPDQDMSNRNISTDHRFQSNQGLPKREMFNPEVSSNQGYQANQSFPDREMSNTGINTNQGIQANQGFPNRDISNTGINTTNQGFRTNQGLPNREISNTGINTNQGFRTNQGFPHRDLSNTGINTNQGIQANQGFPHRDLSNTGKNTNQGYQANQGFPNRDISNTGINTNQGYQANQGFPNRDISNTGINTNQGYQANQGFPNRDISNTGLNTNQGYQANQGFPNRDISNTGINPNQGYQANQGFPNRDVSNTGINPNQGYQANQGFPNRDISNTGINTNQGYKANRSFPNKDMSNSGIKMNQGFPNRGMPNYGMSTNQGFQTNPHFSNRAMHNTDMNANRGFHPSQEMSNKGLPNSEINANQGYQSNQSFSGSSLPYQGENRSQDYQKSQDMPERGISNPRINTGQSFPSNQNNPIEGMSGPVMNNWSLYNQQNYTPDSTENFHLSNEKLPNSAMQGNERYNMYQHAHLDRNSQGQMSSAGMQQGATPQNDMPQASIVQHVMIPVPVPIGTDIPSHLLRPQIITSTQNQYPRAPIPELQNQGQVSNVQDQFPARQGLFQGQNQMPNLQGQMNMSENPIHGQINAPDMGIQANRSVVNELSYYMGNESRNVSRERSTDCFHSSHNRDIKDNSQRKIDGEMNEKRVPYKEDNRHFGHDNFQTRQVESESERTRNDRSRSQSSSKHSSYTPDYFERSGHDVPRTSTGSQMYDKEHPYRKQDGLDFKDITNTGQLKYKERNEAFESQNRFGRGHKAEQQIEYSREMEYGKVGNERYDHHDSARLSDNYGGKQNVQHSNDSRDNQRQESEKRSGAVLYTDGKLDNTRTSDITNEFERHSDLHALSDRKHETLERKVNTTKESSSAIIFKNENSEVFEDRVIEQYDRDKRKNSPVPIPISSKKLKREYSPVSDNMSHSELKIHVSDSGRWIEGNSDLSPVSDCADEVERYDSLRNKGEFDNFKQEEAEYDQTSLDGAEMVSDSESYIEDMRDDKLKIYAHNLSPVSQHSEHSKNKSDCRTEMRSDDIIYPDAERVSPSRSNYSRFSDERSQSHKSRHSDDKRKSVELSEVSGHLSDHKSHQSDRILNIKLNVPNLCRAHIQKGCYRSSCVYLHVCRFFILDQCKFGENCSKGHDFFQSQPYGVITKANPGIRNINSFVEEIKAILKDRIKSNTPASNNKKPNSNFVGKELSPIRDPQNDVVAADPTFDARNYAAGNIIVDAREKLDKKKPSINASKNKSDQSQTSVSKTKTEQKHKTIDKGKSGMKTNRGKDNGSKYKLNDKNNSGKDDKRIKQKSGNQTKTVQNTDENMLSPVSGDEDDWEKYEKYEQISDNGMSDKEDELDNVSSDESIIEQVQVNRSVESFPLPTAENIAVPIGMNDPLVFNRPLKNNTQSYIGPMNRPPPMFPIAGESSNAPLFPVIAGQNQPGFTGMPVPGHVPNYLPSPSFMKEVIKNLPPFKAEPSGKNVFKNDNNPRPEVDSPKRKIKSDKVEKDPDLKQTFKKLWKFPHKGIISMSIIEFVTETEAYKEEFIAEIVKILVTLELPYVTMKKLLSVIKEKISINVKSETDMRKILEMYPNNFKMIEMVDSDDEGDDSDAKKSIQIKANIGVGFCEKHGFLPFALGKCECNALHLCKFYFLSDCPLKMCKFGHKLKTDHNVAVLKQHKLHRLTGEEILNFIADIDNRNKETIPSICKYYIREKGCYKGDNTDFETICHNLHLCAYILKGKCMNRDCDRSHSIHDKQPLSLLQKYGLDPKELGDEKVLLMLGEKCIANEKGKKVGSSKQNMGTKSSGISRSSSFAKDNKGSKGETRKIAGEGLNIVTHTETRLSSKYFVQNFQVPAVCKFYQNALGCRKKDWGSAGKCFFLHICQHYVAGDCNYGDKCKRSHDLFSGQAAEILEKYNFDLDSLSASEILRRLNNNSGAPVELPSDRKSLNADNVNIEVTIDSVGEPDEIHISNFESSKQMMETETTGAGEDNDDTAIEKVERQQERKKSKSSSRTGASFPSGNVEDVIKHIMEHNKVDKK